MRKRVGTVVAALAVFAGVLAVGAGPAAAKPPDKICLHAPWDTESEIYCAHLQ